MAELINREIGRLGKPRHLVLGMDPGISSCGFALLDVNNHEILEMGVRLFDSPVNPKNRLSLAVERRGYRSTRRNNDRTQDRLKHCLRLMQEEGLVPKGASREYFHTVAGDKQPLVLRRAGLDVLLTDREWALVLYSICKRRGYIPHGEGAKGGDAEEGKVLSALKKNKELFAQSGSRTVGEWLAKEGRSRNRGGNYDRCISHESLRSEIKTLFEAQRARGSRFASQEFMKKYLVIFDWERPRAEFDRRVYEQMVKPCSIFPNEKCAARCTLTSEIVAAYGALGNVSIARVGGEPRGITSDIRDLCMAKLFSADSAAKKSEVTVKYSALRKLLDLDSNEYFKGVSLEDEKKREVYEPKGWRALREALVDSDPELLRKLKADRDLADSVMEAVAYSSAVPVLKDRLNELGLSEAEIEELSALPFSSRSLNGYGRRSKKALDILCDAFDDPDVITLSEAERASGLADYKDARPSIERSNKLMPYLSWAAFTGRTSNNPVVIRAISQMRKVVNAVCRKWGVPNEIHIELDRELSLPKKAREAIEKTNRKNEADRKRIAAQVADLIGCSSDEVSGKQIEKYRLWEEQDNFDIYTGEAIEIDRLVRDETYTQIDHILPFSRTGDNSRHNKVLVLSSSNQHKRDLAPYEWMVESGDPNAPDWNGFVARVQANGKLSRRKKSFLLEQDLDSKEVEFQKRNMTDTAYMSREVTRYLDDCLQFPVDGAKAHVVAVTGRATAWLRHRWGLNYGPAGEKDRSDDRHHAVDACVIAAINRSLVIKTAKVHQETHWRVTGGMSREERKAIRMEALKGTMPWPSFASDVSIRREFVVPTRFVPRKGTGELFEQTVYGFIGKNEKGKYLGRKAGCKLGDLDKPVVAGNALASADGKSFVKVGDMLCLRLWHDPEAQRRGGCKGCWYADPVYKADIPALKDGSYVPRIAKAHVGRDSWEAVPSNAMEERPVEIYLGDTVRIGNQVGRYVGYNIDNANWSFEDLTSRNPVKMPTVGQLTNDTRPVVSREGIL